MTIFKVGDRVDIYHPDSNKIRYEGAVIVEIKGGTIKYFNQGQDDYCKAEVRDCRPVS